MPRFRVHMESPDLTRDDGSPHIRVTTMQADNEDAARAYCERQEMRIASHEYPGAAIAEMEAIESASLEAAKLQGTVMRKAAGREARKAAIENKLKPDEIDAAQKSAEDAVKDPDGRAPAQVRMRLATHRQTKPYVIVEIEELS